MASVSFTTPHLIPQRTLDGGKVAPIFITFPSMQAMTQAFAAALNNTSFSFFIRDGPWLVQGFPKLPEYTIVKSECCIHCVLNVNIVDKTLCGWIKLEQEANTPTKGVH